METNPYDYYEQCRFDAFCKAVLRNEARAYLRNMKRQRNRELTFSDLSQEELDKLYAVDRYPSDSFVFSAHGYELHIDNELVAEAFAKLSKTEQSILILHCVLDMADGEIGSLMGMSRSAVQRHRQWVGPCENHTGVKIPWSWAASRPCFAHIYKKPLF